MRAARGVAAALAALSAAALVVSAAPAAGAADDVTAPVVTSIQVLTPTVQAGDAVVLRIVASDDLSGVASISARLSGSGPTTVALASPGGNAAFLTPLGLVSGVVPVGAQGGGYTLVSVVVVDVAGNSTTYTPGSAVSVPAPVAPPDPLDLAPGAVTVVQPVGRDVTAPRITAFSMLTTGVRHPGEHVTFSFATSDAQSPVTEVSVRMCDPLDAQVVGVRGGGRLQAGRLSVLVPLGMAPGFTWHVCGVSVSDSSGNSRSTSAYSSFSVPLAAGPVRADPLVTPDSRPAAVVTAAASPTSGPRGTVVRLTGTVTYAGAPVPYPTIAVVADRAGVRSLVGIVHGAATGFWSRRVIASATTVYRTYLLGSDRGGAAAPAGLGRLVKVLVGARQTLVVASTTVRVRAGRSAPLTVTLLPRRAATVVLQRWTGRTWVAAATVRTRSTGVVTVKVLRAARTYRWVAAYDGVGLPAVSAAVRVVPV